MEDSQQRRTSRHRDSDGDADSDGAPSARSSSQHQGFDGGHGHAEQSAAGSRQPHDVIQLVRDAIASTYK